MRKRKITKKHLILAALFLSIFPLAIVISSTFFTVESTLQGIALMEKGRSEIVQNPTNAIQTFRQSKLTFDKPVVLLRNSDWLTKIVSVFPPFSWGLDLNRASANLSEAGTILAELVESYPQVEKSNDISTLLSTQTSAFSPWYTTHRESLAALTLQLQEANEALQRAPNFIAFGKRAELQQAKRQLSTLTSKLPAALSTLDALQEAAGKGSADPRTFLLVFQNSNELRPTGGFIGSYATISASGGVLRSFTFGENVYTIDKAINPPLPAPTILRTINEIQGFRDSNVGYGFLSDAAENVQQTFAKATGITPQAILFLDVSILEDILRATGPIPLPNTDQIVTAETVATSINAYTQQEYFQSNENKAINRPKDILGDLIPILLGKLFAEPAAQRTFFASLPAIVERKSLQLWLADTAANSVLQTLLPSDSPTQGTPWLKVVNTNIGGLKSSRNIEQKTFLEPDGESLRITLTRKHIGSNTFPDGDNKNYTEIFLPPGTEVHELPQSQGGAMNNPEAEPIDTSAKVTRSAAYTSIGFWSTTNVGETTTYSMRISLSAFLREKPLTILKQAGSVRETVATPKEEKEILSNTSISF